MAQQIQEMFPDLDPAAIEEQLKVQRKFDAVLESALSGQIRQRQRVAQQQEHLGLQQNHRVQQSTHQSTNEGSYESKVQNLNGNIRSTDGCSDADEEQDMQEPPPKMEWTQDYDERQRRYQLHKKWMVYQSRKHYISRQKGKQPIVQ
ncbi:hypothetical protein MIR68_010354 [Amoeboaphelidium protococcarum]|nr:hypothetical protein MIR68_010354 [Amoeboaphelidium protococcarum]